MANYKVPRHVAVIDQLPINATGKVVKDRPASPRRAATPKGPRRDRTAASVDARVSCPSSSNERYVDERLVDRRDRWAIGRRVARRTTPTSGRASGRDPALAGHVRRHRRRGPPAGRPAAGVPASSPARPWPSSSRTGARRWCRSPRWRWVATCWCRSSTSTAARRWRSSSSRAARWRTSRRSPTATSTTPRSSTSRPAAAAPAARRRRRWRVRPSRRPASPGSAGSRSIATSRPADAPDGRADDVAVLAYTSGTTSDPKGVIHDHRTLLSELRAHGRLDHAREVRT